MSGSSARVAQLKSADQARRLSRDELISIHIREEDVELASFGGGTVRLKSMTHRRRRELREEAGYGTEAWDDDLFTAFCVVECMVDPPLTRDDAFQLMEQDAGTWDEITLHVNLINLPSTKKTVKDLGKDSSPTEN